MKNSPYFTIKDIANYAGYNTPSMVDYLVRSGLLKPLKKYPYRKGRRRLFDLKQLILAKVYKEILSKGISVAKIKKAVEKSQELKSAQFLFSGINAGGYGVAKYFVTDGTNIFLRTIKEENVLNLATGQFSFSYMLDIGEIHKHVVEKVFEDRPLLASSEALRST